MARFICSSALCEQLARAHWRAGEIDRLAKADTSSTCVFPSPALSRSPGGLQLRLRIGSRAVLSRCKPAANRFAHPNTASARRFQTPARACVSTSHTCHAVARPRALKPHTRPLFLLRGAFSRPLSASAARPLARRQRLEGRGDAMRWRDVHVAGCANDVCVADACTGVCVGCFSARCVCCACSARMCVCVCVYETCYERTNKHTPCAVVCATLIFFTSKHVHSHTPVRLLHSHPLLFSLSPPVPPIFSLSARCSPLCVRAAGSLWHGPARAADVDAKRARAEGSARRELERERVVV